MAEVPPFLWADAGDFDSPVVYSVPGSGEVQPYTATATYDNGSGQAILPALRIKSDSGNLLSLTFPVGQTIADGDAQEVTFVPPFGSAQGSSPSASATPEWAIFTKDSNMVVPSTTLTSLTSSAFATSNTAVFATTPNGTAGDTTLALFGRGMYLSIGQVQWQAAFTAEHEAYVDVSPVLDGTPTWASPWAGMLRWAYTLAGSDVGNTFFPNGGSIAGMDVRPIYVSPTITLPVNVELRAQQWSGVNRNARGRLAVLFWPASETYTVVY